MPSIELTAQEYRSRLKTIPFMEEPSLIRTVSSTTGFITPLSVRSPLMKARSAPTTVIAVKWHEIKVEVFASRKPGDNISPS